MNACMAAQSNPASEVGGPGEFVLWTGPRLQAEHQRVARLKRQAMDPEVVHPSSDDLRSLLTRAHALAGEALQGVLLHGSWARGEAYKASDVDVLIVLDPKLPLTRALYRIWDQEPLTWRGRPVDAHFIHPPSVQKPTGMWAEASLDGIVLYDRDWELSRRLAGIRHAIAAGRIVRKVSHGHPYWTDCR